jgi:FixJ family two-component response regulator
MASTSGSSAKSATLVALVDDNASIRRGISRLLSANGFRVETHHSGESFLGRRDAEAPGCIILDLHMGGLSGLEVRRQLRLRGVAPPIIFVTAHYAADTQDILGQACDVPCLRKPFTGKALIGLIRHTLGE